MEGIKRIDRTFVRKCHVLDYYEDTMQTEDGRIAKWDFFHHVGAASVVPVMDDGRIIMVRQYRNTVDRDSIEIPAGKRDSADEDTLICASRELEEETGYHSDNIELLVRLVTAIAYCDEFIDIYVAKDLVPTKQDLDDDEYINVEFYTVDELKKMIFDGTIRDAKTVAALMAYMVKYQEN